MTVTGAKPRRRRIWRYLLWLTLSGALLLSCLLWYMTTDSFQSTVRRRIVAELERITGGKAEVGSLHTIPFQFQIEARNITIHGREAATDIPYAHVDSLTAQVKVISLLSAEFGFRSIVIERPVIHIIVYPDGTTNQPAPKVQQTSSEASVKQLFSLSINHLQVRRGELLWNDQKMPLDFVANDVLADLNYSLLRRHYTVNLLVGKADTKLKSYRPLAWTAEAHFTFAHDGVEVRLLKATSGRSHFEMNGSMHNFSQPQIDANYDATLDLAEAGGVARQPGVRRGVLQAVGKGSWSGESFSALGKLIAKDVDWHNDYLNLHGVTATSQFSISPQRLALSQLEARLLGGFVSGEAEITDWLGSPVPVRNKTGKKQSEQKGIVRLRAKDISAGEVLAALSSPSYPLTKINVAGVSSGIVETRWKGSLNDADVDVSLDVAPPATLAAGETPLTAHAHAIFHERSGGWDISEATGATRSSQLHGSGELADSGVLTLAVTTSDLGEWQRILGAFGAPVKIPAMLHGQASFKGTAKGKIADPILSGKLVAEDFDATVPATSRTPEKQVHWDYLDADVLLSQHGFSVRNGTLQHKDASIDFEASTGLHNWRFTDDSQFTAHLDMHHAQVDELIALAGSDFPATGTIEFSLQAAGSGADAHGEGHIQITNAVVRGQSVQHFNANISVSGQQISLSEIDLAHSDARVTGAASYDFSAHVFHCNLNGTNFNLAEIPELSRSRVPIEGRMDFVAQSSGSLERPEINATVQLHNLTFDHELAGDFVLTGTTKGTQLHLTGRSQFMDTELSFDGDVEPRGTWIGTVDAHFTHLDVDPLLSAYVDGRVTGHSTVSGEIKLQGPMAHPRDLNITGDLSELSAGIENVKVKNDGPVRFAMSQERLTIEQLHLVGDNTDLSASGSVQLTGEKALNFKAQGKANLQLIQTLYPDFVSGGTVSVDATVSGSVSKPAVQGRVQFTNGSIAYSDLPSALSDVNGSLTFNQNRLEIENVTAHMGGGLVTLSGQASAYNHQLNFDLVAKGEGVRLRYPPGVSSTANEELHFVGSSSASTLSGDITINKLAITPGFDFGAYLERSAQAANLPQTNPLLNRIRLDVHVTTAPELQMQSAIIRLSGDADLRLRGTAAKPVILGRADVIEGEAYFNGTKYRLERGDVIFTNPVVTTPVLDLQATTQIRDYDVTLLLNGKLDTTDSLKITYRSEPPLPTADIIALLAFGQTTEQSAQLQQSGQGVLGQGASSALLAAALNATISNRVQRLFGVSRIKIDPQGLSTETSTTQSGPALTIEQQISDKLTVSYSANVSQTSQQVIQAEYNVTRSISIVGIRDQNGVISF
ncbi:MAG TPA: translocation/assembly module TamB domain-containing protein, partial [Terriglobales bacterium]|nr:translocation/assembly module TamB domain-containing protein [Terriglobales bacterium]